MPNYYLEMKISDGLNQAAIPKTTFNYISGFSVLSLAKGREFVLKSDENETGLNIFGGSCDITIGGRVYKNLGKRESVFGGLPTGVYIPKGESFTVMSKGVEIGICSAKCEKSTDFAVIEPSEVKVMQVGKENWSREVRMIIGSNSPSVNLLLGETMNPPGNWSGTPPHKHEKSNLPVESLHEELYYFKTDNPDSFGVERLYSPEKKVNEFIHLKNNTVTLMPWGYHQIVAAPGYFLYYMFFLSGEGKELKGLVDPAHSWLIK